MERRLAAILAADMVGYSRLMEADESGIISRQKAHRQALIDPTIQDCSGHIVKTTGDAGGYGMLMGPEASAEEIAEYRRRMEADPGGYIGQPRVEFSSHPTYSDRSFRPRRVDLRPFILYGDRVRVLPGGLTRVALREGSYVVNSSQGGGSKDTWVLEERAR